jgi:hypothetical protein
MNDMEKPFSDWWAEYGTEYSKDSMMYKMCDCAFASGALAQIEVMLADIEKTKEQAK